MSCSTRNRCRGPHSYPRRDGLIDRDAWCAVLGERDSRSIRSRLQGAVGRVASHAPAAAIKPISTFRTRNFI